ncbi:serpin B3-like [Microplitis mediator]|uniref:serpin B3-like n=1 Tax=Microplitis mediator TaxID=375433 RepID=UPI0025555B49|nr:serpin B3-like [Microplitis mediator]
MKVFSFLIILILSIILSSKSESEACVWRNWFCDWITGKNNNEEPTAPSFTEDEKMQGIRNISSSINKFSIKLHQAMAKKTNGSFISSPLSAAMVLMMAAYGARDENANKMNEMLHFDTNNNTYKTGIYSLIKMFDALNPIGFKLANKIYAGKSTKIESDFINLVNTIFQSSFENVDFGHSEDTTTKINNWRAEKNYQRIRNVIESNELNADTELILINSLYFSALWKYPFNRTNNILKKFNINDNEAIEQTIMYNYGLVSYYTKFEALKINAATFEFKSDPNNDEQLRFIILMPRYGYYTNDVEQNLHKLQLSDLYNRTSTLNLWLPKFRIESTMNLEDMLNQLGTNFSGISKQGSGLKMNRVVQKLTLEINELGIEAAVHSEASFNNKIGNSAPPLKQDLIFDEFSFDFLIIYNDIILLTGRFLGK